MGLALVSVKKFQIVLQKIIMWKKNREMEARTGEHLHWKWKATSKAKTPIKTRFVNKIIMFEKTLEFKQVILLCYGK
jgi:hypothetical protein